MNYNQTLDYLFSRLPIYQRVGSAAYKADLDNTIKICTTLGNPQNKLQCIHVAGTNGKLISKEYIVEFVEKHKDAFEKIEPSFFEWTVGLAFDYFANKEVDVAVIEVGLGGRLDSTNVIDPIVSVITNIGLDHMNLLG